MHIEVPDTAGHKIALCNEVQYLGISGADGELALIAAPIRPTSPIGAHSPVQSRRAAPLERVSFSPLYR